MHKNIVLSAKNYSKIYSAEYSQSSTGNFIILGIILAATNESVFPNANRNRAIAFTR
jgi:hypothetical protein